MQRKSGSQVAALAALMAVSMASSANASPKCPPPPVAGVITVMDAPFALDKSLGHTARVGQSAVYVMQTRGGSLVLGLLGAMTGGIGAAVAAGINSSIVDAKTSHLASTLTTNGPFDLAARIRGDLAPGGAGASTPESPASAPPSTTPTVASTAATVAVMSPSAASTPAPVAPAPSSAAPATTQALATPTPAEANPSPAGHPYDVSAALLVSVDADDNVRPMLLIHATDTSSDDGWSKSYFFHFGVVGTRAELESGGLGPMLDKIAPDLPKAIDDTTAVVADDLRGKLGPGEAVKVRSDFMRPLGNVMIPFEALRLPDHGQLAVFRIDGKPGMIRFPTVDGIHLFQTGQFTLQP